MRFSLRCKNILHWVPGINLFWPSIAMSCLEARSALFQLMANHLIIHYITWTNVDLLSIRDVENYMRSNYKRIWSRKCTSKFCLQNSYSVVVQASICWNKRLVKDIVLRLYTYIRTRIYIYIYIYIWLTICTWWLAIIILLGNISIFFHRLGTPRPRTTGCNFCTYYKELPSQSSSLHPNNIMY